MKLLVLTAIIAAVSTSQLTDNQQQTYSQLSPWQVGKVYRYDVEARTLARLEEGASTGTVFKARFIVRVRASGHLLARLEDPKYAQVHHELPRNRELPQNLQFQPVQSFDKPFEIYVDGGRVLSLSVPPELTIPHENLLKGLIGALQVDLSTYHNIHGSQDSFDQNLRQGLFRKMETDVTGDCETLYSVSPVASDWRRELPNFASDEDPIEITKSKNYGHCHHRVEYQFGVPDGAEWTGTAHKAEEDQFIRRAAVTRILASKQGHIYKTETTNTVHVHPHLYGKQKAEVYSNVLLQLVSFEQDSEAEWQKPEGSRLVKSLLYLMTSKQQVYHDRSSSSSSSSSSSESHEHMALNIPQEKTRVRRTANPKIVAVSKIVVKRDSSSSSADSSSSSDSSSAYVNDEIPNINDPAYAALYMSPLSKADQKQNTLNAQKLLQDIAQQLQNPNNMPKADFLSKFNILVRIISSMSTEQLGQTSRSLEVAKSSNNSIKSNMWMIYRDAVVQAGTLPAFQQIKSWIQTKKIQGEEAAQVLSSLANTLRYPTKEAMTQFFQLALSPEVKEQRFLNTSALISATRFINMGHVNNYTAHYHYPSHMYGRLARKHDSFVLDEILPKLSENLKNAVQQGESGKAQVYIKAIGNLGHREILRVFAPYLEGQIPTTTYLRVHMVSSLRVLAQEKDKHVRAVLFSILRNTAEPYEVRIAAANNIFMCHPTSTMIYVMAQMTHNDPSVQVRAFLKSGIESAASLTSPRNLELARSAQAAKWMLTKEEFGYLESIKNLYDDVESEYEQDILSSLVWIGSEDSVFPKKLKYSMRNKNDGWNRQNMILASFSSVQQLIDQLWETAFVGPKQSNVNHKYPAQKIAQMLNIKRDPQQPLEASVYIDLVNQQRFFTFDENDLRRLSVDIKQYMSQVAKGVEKQYTKVFDQAQVSVMFPIAMGMPFIFKYKEPTVFNMQGQLKGTMDYIAEHKGFQGQMEKELKFTYARNIDGQVGFMNTLSDQYCNVGVVNKLQLNIPVKLYIEMKPREVKIRVAPLYLEQDTTLVHYSVWPYSSIQKKDSLVTISQDPTTKLIERSNKIVSTDTKFGQKIGMQFQLQGYSYSYDFRNFRTMFPNNGWLSNIVNVFNQRDVALTHFNFKYYGKQSLNKAVTFNAVYDMLYNQKESGEIGGASEMPDVTPNSVNRRKEIVKRAATGINTARVQVIDLSTIFEGSQKVEYIVTAAVGDSDIDPKIQYVFFAGSNSPQGQSQVNAVGYVKKPDISILNFQQVLKKDLKATIKFDIKYGQGQNSQIQIQADAQRSKRYTEELQKLPIAQECMRQMSENNYYQHACHRIIVMAHTPDQLKAIVSYKNIDQQVANLTYRVYRWTENLGFWNSDVNPMKQSPDGKIEISAEAYYTQHQFNWAMASKYGYINMNNWPIPRWSSGALSFYTPFLAYERIQNYYTHHQFQPYCTVDGSKIRTFSDRSYYYTMTRSWHVVMQDQAYEDTNQDDVVVLARRPSENQQEVYISYKSKFGKDVEIEIKPAPQGSQKPFVEVKTSGQKVSEGELTMYWDDVADQLLLSYYAQPDGVLVLNIGEKRLRVVYDGQRLVVLSSHHRNSTRGICGRMTGEPRHDYETPYGFVDHPEYFAASFALNDENSDPQTQEFNTKAKQQAYQYQHKYTTILRSDIEWQNNMQSSSEENWNGLTVYRSRSYEKQRGPCQLQQQVQYYENHGEICITNSPLPSCQSHCRGENYKVQPAQVICRPKLDQQYKSLRDQIRQGQNPKVSGVPQLKQYKVPTTCTA